MTRWYFVPLLLVVLFSGKETEAAKTAAQEEGSLVTLTLEHSLSPNTFTPRGSITYRLASNALSISNPAHIASGLKLTQLELSLADERSLVVMSCNAISVC